MKERELVKKIFEDTPLGLLKQCLLLPKMANALRILQLKNTLRQFHLGYVDDSLWLLEFERNAHPPSNDRSSNIKNMLEKYLSLRIKYQLERIHESLSIDESIQLKNESDDSLQQLQAELERQYHSDDALAQAKSRFISGGLKLSQEKFVEAVKDYQEAQQIYHRLGNCFNEAQCSRFLGELKLYLSEYKEARQHIFAAQETYCRLGRKESEAGCQRLLCEVDVIQNRNTSARKRFIKVLDTYQQIGNLRGEARCVIGLGDTCSKSFGFNHARKYYMQAYDIYERLGDRYGEIISLNKLRVLYEDRSFDLSDRQIFDDDGYRYSELHRPRGMDILHHSLISFKLLKKEFDDALSLFDSAVEKSRNKALWYLKRASFLIFMRRSEQAAEDIEQAAHLLSDHPYVILKRGDLACLQGELDVADGYYHRVLAEYPRQNLARFGLGRVHLYRGELSDAKIAYRKGKEQTISTSEMEDEARELEKMKSETEDEQTKQVIDRIQRSLERVDFSF